jgi:predicted pyridoxine 5'-phosphate oxidase superfamily flavin-nucleotide-binding protein
MTIATLAELEALYTPAPSPAAIVKEVDRITPHDQRLIGASPFVALESVRLLLKRSFNLSL